MPHSHEQTIYDGIGAETIEVIVQAFYPKVYTDSDLIPIFTIVEMGEIIQKQLFLTPFPGVHLYLVKKLAHQ